MNTPAQCGAIKPPKTDIYSEAPHDRVWGVGFRRIALVPRTWGNANSRAGSVYGALPVFQ